MPRLPAKDYGSPDLGQRPVVTTPNVDTSTGSQQITQGLGQLAQGQAAFGRGQQQLAGAVSGVIDEEQKRIDTLETAQADANLTDNLVNIKRSFDQDPDYATFGPRFDTARGLAIEQAAAGISNPLVREKFLAHAQQKSATYKNHVVNLGDTLRRQGEEVALDNTLTRYSNAYMNPAADDATKLRIQADMDAAIVAGERSGLIRPKAAEALRDKYLSGVAYADAEKRLWNDPTGLLSDLGAIPRQGGIAAPPSSGSLSESGRKFIMGLEGDKDNGWDKKQFSGPYGVRREEGERLTKAEAEKRLTAETDNIALTINKGVSRELNQAQMDALISFGYNVGKENLKKILPLVEAGDDQAVAAKMLEYTKATDSRTGVTEDMPGLLDRRLKEASLYMNGEEAPKYVRLSPQQRHALVTRGKTALSALTQQDVKDEIEQIRETGSAPLDAQGRTAVDRAGLYLQPNQVNKLRIAANEAKLEYDAISPLRSMTEQDAINHINQIVDKDAGGEGYASQVRAARKAEAAWTEIVKQRHADPAEAVDPSRDVRRSKAGASYRDPEVATTYEMIKNKMPGVKLQQNAAGGFDIADADERDAAAVQATQRARAMLMDARVQAQANLGMPKDDRIPISKREADALLQLPDDPNAVDVKEYKIRLKNAAALAIEKYGPEYGVYAFEGALKLHKRGDEDHKSAAEMQLKAMARLAQGQTPTAADMRKLKDLQDIERRGRVYDYPRREEMYVPPPPPPADRLGIGKGLTKPNYFDQFD